MSLLCSAMPPRAPGDRQHDVSALRPSHLEAYGRMGLDVLFPVSANQGRVTAPDANCLRFGCSPLDP